MNKNEQDMRISDAELSMIKNTFAENDLLLKVLRKIFLPELDVDAPIGEIVDLWMSCPVDNMTPEQAVINIKARNAYIKGLEMGLMQLKVLAGKKDETIEQTKERLKRDSNK